MKSETTVLIAVGYAPVREALVAMFTSHEGFRVVAEVNSDSAALRAARDLHPDLAVIEPELSNCGGWWALQQIRSEGLASVVIALGRRPDVALAQALGAHLHLQIGTSPRELLNAVYGLLATSSVGVSGSAVETEAHLLADTHTVI